MASCPQSTACAITQNISMKPALGVWQSFYCEGSFPRCERFKLANAGLGVPVRLLPNGRLQDPGDQAAEVPASTRAA